jgi:hypothetical protein
MTWTRDKIEREWLGGSPIAVGEEVATNAFNRVDAILGPDWIERYRAAHGGANRRGPMLTLPVVILGNELAHIKGATGCEGLVRKLRRLKTDAEAELHAIALVMTGLDDLRLECEPRVIASGRKRKADFRVAKDRDHWVYVEVTQPDTSAAEKTLLLAVEKLSQVVCSVDGSYATEVFFHKRPTPDELVRVLPVVEEACRRGHGTTRLLPDELGVVYVDRTTPTVAIAGEHHGQPYTPRIVRATFVGHETADRHLQVSVPYFDHRAAQFLEESGQLPDDGPGVIMIQMNRATGGMKKWAPTLREQLRLDMYSNVSLSVSSRLPSSIPSAARRRRSQRWSCPTLAPLTSFQSGWISA